jgi:hypothetical protein
MLLVWTAEGSAARLVAELPLANVTGVRVDETKAGRPALRYAEWLSSWYARHKSIHVAINICLGEVQRLNRV